MTGPAEPLTEWAGRPIATLREEWGVPRLLAFDAVTSTNDVARACAEDGAPPFTVVLAETQTSGRGRRGRTWEAPRASSLLVSILLRPLPPPPGDAPTTAPLRIGLAVARAIEHATRLRTALKWPNDVLAPDDRKVAGILCEGAHGPGSSHYVVAGIGINVSQSLADWPAALRGRAASLAEFAGHAIDRCALAGSLIAELRSAAPRFGRPLSDAECAAWTERDALRGRAVRVDDRLEGIAEGVTPEGGLRLRGAAGPAVLWTGTVRVLEVAAAAAHDPPLREDPR